MHYGNRVMHYGNRVIFLASLLYLAFILYYYCHSKTFNDINPTSITSSSSDNNTFINISNNNNNIIYAWLHIPKTGGTTAYNAFMRSLHEKTNVTIYPITHNRIQDFNTPGCPDQRKPKYGGTHCAISEIHDCLARKLFPNSTVKFLTIIRHPVDRVISEYFYWRFETKNMPWRWTSSMINNRDNITAWILDNTNVAHNRQALMILLNTPHPADTNCTAFKATLALDWIQKNFGSIKAFNCNTQSNLILKALKKLCFIASLNDIESSIVAFEKKFGIPIDKQMFRERSHTSNSESQLIANEKDVRTMILQRNKLDMVIYETVKKQLQSFQ